MMNNNRNSKQGNEEKKEFMEITTTEFEPHNPHYDSTFITASDLAGMINKYFGLVFTDYVGCKLIPVVGMNTPNKYSLDLLFRPMGGVDNSTEFKSGKVAAFVDISKEESNKMKQMNKSEEIFANLKQSNVRHVNKNFELSQNAAEMLRNLIMPVYIGNGNGGYDKFINDPKPQRYTFNRLEGEKVAYKSQYGRSVPVVETKITGIDVDRVLGLIKGDKNKNKEKLLWRLRPVTEIYASVPNNVGIVPVRSETILEMVCLNVNNWGAFIDKVGMINQPDDGIYVYHGNNNQ